MSIDHAHADDLAALRGAFETIPHEPPLGWSALHAFEKKMGVQLPEPYRTFVAEICNGCKDGPPESGLLPLGTLPSDWGDDGSRRILTTPFPLEEAWFWATEPEPSSGSAVFQEDVYDHGSVVLGTDGCGMYWHLVVTGDSRGHIWMISEAGAVPFGEQFGYTTAHSGFAGWVKHWVQGKEWYDAA
jgi:hypothetical protein